MLLFVMDEVEIFAIADVAAEAVEFIEVSIDGLSLCLPVRKT